MSGSHPGTDGEGPTHPVLPIRFALEGYASVRRMQNNFDGFCADIRLLSPRGGFRLITRSRSL